jgi:hypothetical protein
MKQKRKATGTHEEANAQSGTATRTVVHPRGNSEVPGAFIPVGCTTAKPRKPLLDPCDVRTADDLPRRLYLGSLAPETFEANDDGWSACYQDADPDTHVRLRYEAAGNTLSGFFVWRGISGMSVFADGTRWGTFARYMGMPLPPEWEAEMARICAARFNLEYKPTARGAPSLVGLPDGALMTLLVPLPPSRLPALTGCLDAIEADPAIETSVALGVAEVQARVCRRRGSDVAANPHARGHAEPGEVHCSDETVHLAQVICLFRDLIRVVEHFQQTGFIGSATAEDPTLYPNGTTWRAFVTPAGTAFDTHWIEIKGAIGPRIVYREPFLWPSSDALEQLDETTRTDAEAALRSAMNRANARETQPLQ